MFKGGLSPIRIVPTRPAPERGGFFVARRPHGRAVFLRGGERRSLSLTRRVA
nr:MAG TPA: hypothetical protein [Caudoviricetes sp.]